MSSIPSYTCCSWCSVQRPATSPRPLVGPCQLPRHQWDHRPPVLTSYRNTIFRDTYLETGDTARLPAQLACWTMGDKWSEMCVVRKTYFVLDRLEQPRQDKNLFYRHNLHTYSLILHLPQFRQSAGATPLYSLSGVNSELLMTFLLKLLPREERIHSEENPGPIPPPLNISSPKDSKMSFEVCFQCSSQILRLYSWQWGYQSRRCGIQSPNLIVGYPQQTSCTAYKYRQTDKQD